ncbi:MAG: type II/IV secretion system protein [Planctomycetes bacterium]|nr:type II/IV secretion system protein [Planctomycetota bacterium]
MSAHSPRVRSGAEARRASRWVPALRGRAVVQRIGNGEERSLDVFDVSPSGLGARDRGSALQFAWMDGEAVSLAIDIGGEVQRRRGRVAWALPADDGVRLGIQFDGERNPTPIRLDLDGVRPDPRCALRVPAAQAMRRQVLPLCELDGCVVVACADLSDTASLQAIAHSFDKPLRPQVVDPEQLLRALRSVYGEQRVVVEGASDDPVALCNELLHAAWLRRASDVHVCPERDGIVVKLRVDGELETYRRVPRDLQPELLSRIKVLAGMDIAEKRAPQDGRFTHEFAPGRRVDVRVATLPTNHGERATLRLLAIDVESLTLDNLGFLPADLELARHQLARPHGLIVATGPTGCGKTTTLFAMLRTIVSTRSVNVIAVQEPVEYDFPGISQVEVDANRKVSFATALRSIMRHDPDVIMIGEIRDLETADIAIKAALTGHLVLATLHTNDAPSTITRLVDMGVEPYLLASTLRLVMAQRLVRRLCPACAAPARLSEDDASLLKRPGIGGMEVRVAAGCVCCAGSGYRGRTGLFELLPVDEAIAEGVRRGGGEAAVREAWRATGRADLLDDAITKLRNGTTTFPLVREAIAT